MRAIQITLLFAAAMLWLGIQAAQTEPRGPTDDGTTTTAASIVKTG